MVRPFLLDVSVLVATVWPQHVHHSEAKEWFRRSRSAGFRTCPITQAGFVRLSSSRAFTENAVSPASAIGMLRQMINTPDHEFWPDDLSIQAILIRPIVGHKQITDAYLIALAESKGGTFATLDRAALSIGGPVELVRSV